MHQTVGHPHKTGLSLQLTGLPQLVGPDGAQGQNGGPAAVPALQVLDDRLAVLLPVHHDILHGPAQGGLNGHGILVGHLQQVGHRAVDIPQAPPLGLPHDQLHRLGVALVDLLHFGQHFDAGGQGILLHAQLHIPLPGLLRLLPAALQAQGIAGDDVFHAVPLLQGLIQLLLGLLHVLAGVLQPLLQGGKLPAQALVPVQHLLVGVGGLHGLPVPQLLQLPGQGARGAQGLLGLCVLLLHLAAALLQGLLHLGQAGAALGDLAVQTVLAALPLLQLLPDAGGVFQVVLDVAAQHRHGGVQFPDGGVPALDGKAQLVSLDLLVPHLLGQLLSGPEALLHGPLRRLLLAHRLFIVGLQLDISRPDALQGVQPHGDFKAPQLIPQDQELFGLLALAPQGLHLELQLGNLVVNAQQVVVGALQLALGLLLAVTETGDTRRLLKDLPAVGGLDRQDLVDAALADEGIALPAQTGVHKQLVDIPQAHGAAVDIVLALPRAVVPPGDHDLALVHVKKVGGVVQHQGDLGISRLAALSGAAEDHVLHFAAPQGTGGLFAHDPANGVGNIGFSRTVGAHDGGDILAEGEHSFVGKGFEALDLQCC